MTDGLVNSHQGVSPMPPQWKAAVLGLGEAGSAFARDLAGQGVRVVGWDPRVEAVPPVEGAGNAVEAVQGAAVIISVNAAAVALNVAREVAPYITPEQIFADFNTGSPGLKRALADVIEARGARFVDVALMAPVPGRGLRTPALVSGSGARDFQSLLAPLGMPVEVVDDQPGSAAARKLLRSVVMKGLAAAVIEGLTAAERVGWGQWYREEVATIFREADEALLDRLITGSRRHAARRVHEMDAAAEFLLSLGVPPRVSMASAEWLRDLTRAEKANSGA